MIVERGAVIAVLALLVLSGCIASETYRAHAFVPGPRHYRVRYLPGEENARRVLPEGWRVQGHRVDGEGRPTRPFDRGDHLLHVALDTDGDGRPDLRGRAPRFDLSYEHEEDGAHISASTIPVEPRRGRRSLAILAHDLIDGVFGRGFVELDHQQRAHAFETRHVDEYEAVIGGAPAHLVTLEIAEVVPGRGTAWGSGTTVTLVLVRPEPWRWRPEGLASRDGAPMLVLLLYTARSDRYALHRADFDALLDRLDVRPGDR